MRIAALLLACLLAACELKTDGGTEDGADQVRTVSAFTQVEVSGGLVATITPGSQLVRVKGDKAKVDLVKTEVSDGRLQVFTEVPVSADGLEVIIQAPLLTLVAATAGSAVGASGLSVNQLSALAAGGGVLTLGGQALVLTAEVSGGAVLDGASFTAATATIVASGGSTVHVGVSGQLAVEASGASTVRIIGAPAVTSQSLSGGSQLLFE
jgi:hypothetical protein